MQTLTTLNKEQKEAITYGNGPLLIIAGAGTGKTTVITERIKHLILEKHISPSNLLALTFTEKAASEMEERVDIALPFGYTQMWIDTFHGFCDRVLRQHAIHIGISSDYKMLTEVESLLFLRQNLFEFEFKYFRPLGNPTKFLQGLLQHFSRLKDEDINPEQYLKYAQEISNVKYQMSNEHISHPRGENQSSKNHTSGVDSKKDSGQARMTDKENNAEGLEAEKTLELAKAYETYEMLKLKEGIMDFGGLILNTLKLFRERPNVLKEYQQQFQYILIDEFQDTNFAQNELAMLLAGKDQNITAVGDDDQAIYRWRGAAISNMIQFRERFANTKIVTLTKNYRSTSNVLDAAYTVIQHNNPDRLEVKEKINKKLTAERKVQGPPLEFILRNHGENEAEAVVEKIIELITKKSYSYKDFAILVRANDHSQPFIRALERQKIPYQFLGPGQLFHQEEIKDLIAYLKVLYNFSDSSSLYRVLTMDIFHIPPEDISSLLIFSKQKNISLFETLTNEEIQLTEHGKKQIKLVHDLIQNYLAKISKESAGQILYYFLEESGLLLTYLNVESQEQEIKAQNVARFFERLKSFEMQHDNASVFAVVDWIDLSMQMGESPLAATIDWSEMNGVNILTVHSSKGLEFPVVFIANLVQQRFPSRERKDQIPLSNDLIKEVLPEGDFHLQEERRLFYVAMTRAKDHLFLTAAHIYGDGKRQRKLSPLILEAVGEKRVLDEEEKLKTKSNQLSLLNLFPDTQKLRPKADRPLDETTPIPYISYSQMQTFEICPLHYKLRYILKIPTPQTASQSFGVSVHSALREFYLRQIQGEAITKDDIENILYNVWVNEGYASKQHENLAFKQALVIIANYVDSNPVNDSLPIGLEIPFQFTINKLKVGGRIDRIDRIDEKTLEIIDYKTGNNIPTEKELKDNLQLTLYGLAATEIRDPLFHRKPEEMLLSLYYLEEGKKITTTRTREQLEAAKMTILEKVQLIQESDFECSRNMLCENCEYKILCNVTS